MDFGIVFLISRFIEEIDLDSRFGKLRSIMQIVFYHDLYSQILAQIHLAYGVFR